MPKETQQCCIDLIADSTEICSVINNIKSHERHFNINYAVNEDA